MIAAPMPDALNRVALLLLLAAACLADFAANAGPAVPGNLCGAHLAVTQFTGTHVHCWRCYALAAAALGFTGVAFRQIVRFARPSTLPQG